MCIAAGDARWVDWEYREMDARNTDYTEALTPTYPEPEGFSSFGAYVDWADVPGLVRDGAEVWAAGYGGDSLEAGIAYTVITVDDLWAWGPDENGKGADYDTLRSWAPFRSTDAESPERAGESAYGADGRPVGPGETGGMYRR